MKGTTSFEPHYDKHVECDYCGQQTRGKVFQPSKWAPIVVLCDSCNRVIIGDASLAPVRDLPLSLTQFHKHMKE